ncbi:MAG: hypothetical protein ACH37Z_12230 [Anaerolineae bacterium]
MQPESPQAAFLKRLDLVGWIGRQFRCRREEAEGLLSFARMAGSQPDAFWHTLHFWGVETQAAKRITAETAPLERVRLMGLGEAAQAGQLEQTLRDLVNRVRAAEQTWRASREAIINPEDDEDNG